MDIRQRIEERAREIYEWRVEFGGEKEGDTLSDWLQAEAEIKEHTDWKSLSE